MSKMFERSRYELDENEDYSRDMDDLNDYRYIDEQDPWREEDLKVLRRRALTDEYIGCFAA